MAFQSVPATAEAVVRCIWSSVLVTMTFYASVAVAYDQQAIDDLAEAIDDWMSTDMLPELTDQLSYLSTEVRGLEQEVDFVASNSTGAGIGTGSSTTLPNNVAFAMKRLSGFSGRNARGRVYIPGLSAAFLQGDENYLLQTKADALKFALNNQLAYLTLAGWFPVIVSRYNEGEKRLFGVTFAVDEWDYTDLRLDTRRDRLP